MIAATRDTSTRSTPTPIAVMARRSKAEARREPCGGGQVTAEHQAEPYERHGERGPQRDQWPERRTPMVDRVDLIGPAALLFGGPRFPTQLHHACRELLADVVERHPGLLQAAGHEEAAERRRELRDTQRHRDLHRRAHRASRAARPVRASYWDTK